MFVDALAVRLRPRTPMEATDLGVGLCRGSAREVYAGYALVAVPTFALALATYQIAYWLPSLVLWWAKPWLDCTILFVLSRAAFGQHTRLSDILAASRAVWLRPLLFTLIVQRLSPWRSFTQPVFQLEGLSVWKARSRVRQLLRRHALSAMLVSVAFWIAEVGLWASLTSLVFWFAPTGWEPDLMQLLVAEDTTSTVPLVQASAYAVAIFFLEPFFVAAGFAMYLNRRAELEAWDIEQDFRRAFAG